MLLFGVSGSCSLLAAQRQLLSRVVQTEPFYTLKKVKVGLKVFLCSGPGYSGHLFPPVDTSIVNCSTEHVCEGSHSSCLVSLN